MRSAVKVKPAVISMLPIGRGINRRQVVRATLGLAGLTLVGCSTSAGFRNDAAGGVDLVAWPDRNEWPAIFWAASGEIQETYRFAVANQHLLQWMPCFCGCGDMGHTSNASCIVAEIRGDGSVLLDRMSFG